MNSDEVQGDGHIIRAIKMYIPNIDTSEEVARVITAPSMLENGDVSPAAFSLCDCLPRSKEKEGELLVNRTIFGYPDKDKIKWKPRTKGDKHYGYALLIVKDILDLSFDEYLLEVIPMPSNHNPGHSGVLYYINGKQIYGECDDPGHLEIRLALASMSKLIPFDFPA